MAKDKRLGLSPRVSKPKEVHEEVYDDAIKASELRGREDILIEFNVPDTGTRQKKTGRRFGTPVKWHPRNKTLEVKVVGHNKNYEIAQSQCICAWRTDLPPENKRPKVYVMKPDSEGKMRCKKNPLYRLQLLEMTKGDRDKVNILWE